MNQKKKKDEERCEITGKEKKNMKFPLINRETMRGERRYEWTVQTI